MELLNQNPTRIPVLHREVLNNSDFLTCGWNGNFTDSAEIFLRDKNIKHTLKEGGEIIGLDYHAPFLRPHGETDICWEMGPSLIVCSNNTKIEYVLNMNTSSPSVEYVFRTDHACPMVEGGAHGGLLVPKPAS
jgi:hypothetical protein